MADENGTKPNPIMGDMWFVIGALAVLLVLWIARGGPQKNSTGSFLLPSGSASTTAPTSTAATSTY